jgi:hypothetical protein
MDARERINDQNEALSLALDGLAARMWTSLPGIVQSWNAAANTVAVQPAIQGWVRAQDGTTSFVNLPVVPDVPVLFARGGGYTLTFPIKAGDECVLFFASRCIDAWWQLGGVQKPLDSRRHDLSDAFALVGPMSQVKKISNISATTTQLRSDDGTRFFELDTPNDRARIVLPNVSAVFDDANNQITLTAQKVVIDAATSVTVTAPAVAINP